MKKFRTEGDSLGTMEIPAGAYYGIQTVRGRNNFGITGYRLSSTFIKSMAMVKKATSIMNAEAGVIEQDVANAMVQACEEIIDGKFHDQFLTDVIQGGAGTSMNMNINEVIANRANELMGGKLGKYEFVTPNDHANYGQSTNDVIPTSGKLTVIQLCKSLLEELEELTKSLEEKSVEFDHVIKMGRTHLQDAIPIRLGQEFNAYARPIRRDIARIKETLEDFYFVNMGATAVGTGLNADTTYVKDIAAKLSEVTGIKFKSSTDLVDGTRNVDVFVWLSSALKVCATNLSKMANDLRLMASGPRAGFFEINLPMRQPGSSIMPGKVNPVIPEVMNQVSFQIFGNDLTITKAAEAGQLELNVFEPVLFFNLFQSIQILKNGVQTLNYNCIKGITPNAEITREVVRNSIGIITAINPHVGYKAASDVAKESLKTGEKIRDIVVRKGLLTHKELDVILDVFNMTNPGISGKEIMDAKKNK
jgi:aspartate ammonia-lyase